jgi:sulfate permease, SulP family
MGAIFVVLGGSRFLDVAARAFPRPVIRGVQLVVGLLFLKIAWGLVTDPPAAFADQALSANVAVGLTALALVAALAFKRYSVSLVLVAIGVAIVVAKEGNTVELGPSALVLPSFDAATFATAFTVLVLPQLPLSFANSCLATADAARTYFGERAAKITPSRLATSFGSADLLAGAIGGMPVCHGAGGMTAHVAFGARTGAAPVAMGAALVGLALGVGAGLAALLTAFPIPILAALLAGAGILHIGLLRDLEGVPSWALALLVGLVGFFVHLAIAVVLGLALWWGLRGARAVRTARAAYAR